MQQSSGLFRNPLDNEFFLDFCDLYVLSLSMTILICFLMNLSSAVGILLLSHISSNSSAICCAKRKQQDDKLLEPWNQESK